MGVEKMVTANEKIAAFESALEQWFDKAETVWGTRPNVTIEVLKVGVKFDIGAFPHKGQIVNIGDPEAAAKAVMAEITNHYTGCVDCGEGVPSLYWRRYYLNLVASHVAVGRREFRGLTPLQADRPPPAGIQIWQNREIGVVKYSWSTLLRPPDDMERATHPVIARQVDRLLENEAIINWIDAQDNPPIIPTQLELPLTERVEVNG